MANKRKQRDPILETDTDPTLPAGVEGRSLDGPEDVPDNEDQSSEGEFVKTYVVQGENASLDELELNLVTQARQAGLTLRGEPTVSSRKTVVGRHGPVEHITLTAPVEVTATA